MAELIKKQEEESQNFNNDVFMAWQPVKKNEQMLLEPYNNDYDKAPKSIQQKINQDKESFTAEWGSNGRLITLMKNQHEKERKQVILQTDLLETLDKNRSKDHDNGR